MFSRLLQRQTKAMIVNMPARNFSLLAPLQSKSLPPADVVSAPLTEAALKKQTEDYDKFNEDCERELDAMNSNLIENIVQRGGTSGWDTAEDYSSLSKSFEFSSFE